MEYLRALKRVMLQQVVDQVAEKVAASPLQPRIQLAYHRVLVFLPVLEKVLQHCLHLLLGQLVGEEALAETLGHRVALAVLDLANFLDHPASWCDLHGQLPQLLVWHAVLAKVLPVGQQTQNWPTYSNVAF